MQLEVLESHVEDKKTRPPRRFTEGTLLTAMETAGKTLDDKELSDAMRQCGLGTPATRASTIETLLQREYIVREKKTLLATEKGIGLIESQLQLLIRPPASSGEDLGAGAPPKVRPRGPRRTRRPPNEAVEASEETQ